MKVVRRTRSPQHEPDTAVTRVVEEGTTPPPGPPLEPAPDRELWPWLLLLLVLVIGGIVAAVVLTSNDKKKNSAPGTTLATPPATTVTVARVTTPKTPAPTTKKPAPAVARLKLANVLGISASTAVKRLRDDGFQPVVQQRFLDEAAGGRRDAETDARHEARQGSGGDAERLEGPAREAGAGRRRPVRKPGARPPEGGGVRSDSGLRAVGRDKGERDRADAESRREGAAGEARAAERIERGDAVRRHDHRVNFCRNHAGAAEARAAR